MHGSSGARRIVCKGDLGALGDPTLLRRDYGGQSSTAFAVFGRLQRS